METKIIPISEIRIDGNTQQRDIDSIRSQDFVALMKDGVKFPPLDVIYDGKVYWLWDGFHRYHAAGNAGFDKVKVKTENGDVRKAVWLSFSANREHGLPTDRSTKKHIILKILADEEWGEKTQVEIAKHVGTNQAWVSKIIKEQVKATSIPANTESVSEDDPESLETGSDDKEKTSKKKTKKPDKDAPVLDDLKNELPDDIALIFQNKDKLQDPINTLNKVLKEIEELCEMNNPVTVHFPLNEFQRDMADAKRDLRFAIPYCLCPVCGGTGDDCLYCKGFGFLTKKKHNMLPKDMRWE